MRAIRAIIGLGVFAAALVAVFEVFRWHPISIETARETLPSRLATKGLSLGEPIFIRIFKEEAALEVWMEGRNGWQLFQIYPICRFSGGLGPKLKTGDKQAPEGFYRISLPQLNPYSRHHRAFNLGFPNEYDRSLGRTGSYLMVHGGCTSAGCYAMTDARVDDIYRLVEAALENGQSAVDVHAFPFRMTGANMARHEGSKWQAFWRDLKRGYDLFEETHAIPVAGVEQGRYVFFRATALPSSAGKAKGPRLITAWR